MQTSLAAAALVDDARRLMLRGLGVTALFSAFVNIAFLIHPLFMMEVYGRVIPAQSRDTLWALLAIAAFALVIYALLEFARGFTYQRIATGVARKLNLPALEAAVSASVAGGTREATTAIRDISDLRGFLSGSAVNVPFEAAFSVIFVAVLYMLHPLFGHLAVGAIMAVTLLNLLADRLTRTPIREANEAQARYVADVGGALRHAEAIEAMGMLPALVAGWREREAVMLDRSESANLRARALLAFLRAVSIGTQILTVALGAILVMRQEIPTAAMFVAMVLSGRATSPFSALAESWRQWITAAGAWTRLTDLFARAAPGRMTTPMALGGGGLVAERLSHVPPGSDVPVLRGVSFELKPGEVLGVVGPSGAGKSTLARMIVGVGRPTAGGVYLDGTSTYAWERGSFGRAVGYLPQHLALIDGTVRRVIARMEEGDPRLVVRAARAAGIHELIGRLPFGYDTPIAEGAHRLSGGQLQRLALARALYGDPGLIVLDEPNANLDMAGERALVEAILAARARGAMVVLIAHRPSVMQVADRLLVLQEGRVAQFGPRTEIIDSILPDVRPAPRGRPAQVTAIGRRGDGG